MTIAANVVARAAVATAAEGRGPAGLHDRDGVPIVGRGQPEARRTGCLRGDSLCKETACRSEPMLRHIFCYYRHQKCPRTKGDFKHRTIDRLVAGEGSEPCESDRRHSCEVLWLVM